MGMTRREVLRWLGAWSGALVTAPPVHALARLRPVRAFTPRLRAVQITDLHYGYRGSGNPDPAASLSQALYQIQQLNPELLLITGDLIEADADPRVRERRLEDIWERLQGLRIPLLAVPGEQDALMDAGALWQRVVGPLHFHEASGGVHVIGLDNVSRGFLLGRSERDWLAQELRSLDEGVPLLVAAHAPLAWYYPAWNWYTYDGPAASAMVARFPHRLFVHGHVHQLLTDEVGGVKGFGARAVSFSYPLPDSRHALALMPIPMAAGAVDTGLGLRDIRFAGTFQITDRPLAPLAGSVKP